MHLLLSRPFFHGVIILQFSNICTTYNKLIDYPLFFTFSAFPFLSIYVLLIVIRGFFARTKMNGRVRSLLCKYIFYVCWWLCSVTHSDWILRSGHNNATRLYVANTDINRIYMIHSCIFIKQRFCIIIMPFIQVVLAFSPVKINLFCTQQVFHEK